MGTLLAHESWVKKGDVKVEEKAFQVKESSTRGRNENFGGHGRGGRFSYRGRGRDNGRSRGRFGEIGKGQGHFGNVCRCGESSQNKSAIQCQYCKKYGHKEAQCWSKQGGEQEQRVANFTQKVEEESKLFIARTNTADIANSVWFIDSGCSSHMSSSKSLFRDRDESEKSEV